MRVAALALALTGCLGPILPLPKTPHLAHEWLCVNRACPSDAMAAGGVVTGVEYMRSIRRCRCAIEDSRHLLSITYPDPHTTR